MAVDAVCQQVVEEQQAFRDGLYVEFDGECYYFCSEHCRNEFARHPTGYTLRDALGRASEEGMPPPDYRPG